MKDSVRYKRKRIQGKSGDSGDENVDETTNDGDESNDFLSFLIPSSTRFPRKTMTIGAGADFTTPRTVTSSQQSDDAYIAQEDARWPHELDDDSSRSTVYSFVSCKSNY